MSDKLDHLSAQVEVLSDQTACHERAANLRTRKESCYPGGADRRGRAILASRQPVPPGCMFFSNRSVKQREDMLTNKLAAYTHVIVRKTQIAQCGTVNTGETPGILYAGGQLCFSCLATLVNFFYKSTRIILSLPAISNGILLIYIEY